MRAIEVNNLTHIYHPHSPYKRLALQDVSFSVEDGEFLGIAGTNGSGKSTLVKHFNGLLTPTAGTVTVFGTEVSTEQSIYRLWRTVGLVFQFPEHQLFETTVYDDIAYGPRNLGLTEGEIRSRVDEALLAVGLDTGITAQNSFVLSGGTRRRVAIASVLAAKPRILILDEPAAGLDFWGRREILGTIKRLQLEQTATVIMVSHSLTDLLALSDRIVVLSEGRLAAWGSPVKLMSSHAFENTGIILPQYLELVVELEQRGIKIETGLRDIEKIEHELDHLLKEGSSS